MMLSDLAEAARRSGLPVDEVPGWRERGHGELSGLRTIVAHHTATPLTSRGSFPSLAIVRDGTADLPGPLAHLGLGRDGTVHVIAAGLAYHAGEVRDPDAANEWSLGIEAEHDGVTPWPLELAVAYARLCRALADHYRLPYDRVLGHKEVCAPPGRKIDPNLDMDDFRDRIRTLDPTPEPG